MMLIWYFKLLLSFKIGKIYTTEEIAKYGMQIEKESNEKPKDRTASSSSLVTVTSESEEKTAQIGQNN
jgi:hypothetical protein